MVETYTTSDMLALTNGKYTMNSIHDIISTQSHIDRTLEGEKIWELKVLPHLLKVRKTDMGLSFGLPEFIWDGSYNQNGERKMIRLQDIIHHGAWKKHLLRPQPHNLPPGFTIVHISLMTVPIEFTRFFILHYSKRYKALPPESKKQLYNAVRVCAFYEAFEGKTELQSLDLQAFSCHWVYEQYMKGRELREAYQRGIPKINGEIRRCGYDKEVKKLVREARQAKHYERFNFEVSNIAAIQPPFIIPALPAGIPEFTIWEELPAEVLQ